MGVDATFPPLAWTESDLLVTAEGKMLLAYDAATEGPVWLGDLESSVLSVADAIDRIVALTVEGQMFELGIDGARIAVRAVAGARGVVATRDARCVFGPRETLLVDRDGKLRTLKITDVGGAAFSSDGTLLLVGTRGGETHLLDPTTGAPLATGKAPGTITGVAWSPAGYFVASVRFAKGGIARVDAETAGVKPLVGMGDVAIDAVSCSRDGKFVATRIADGRVAIFDAAGNRPVGMVTYGPPETPGQIAFGVGSWLAIAIGHGDANKVELATGAVHRTDPHAGRERHRWLLVSDVDAARARSVLGDAALPHLLGPASTPPPAPGSTLSPLGWIRLLFGLFALMLIAYALLSR